VLKVLVLVLVLVSQYKYSVQMITSAQVAMPELALVPTLLAERML
jgi:hypothetical protein